MREIFEIFGLGGTLVFDPEPLDRRVYGSAYSPPVADRPTLDLGAYRASVDDLRSVIVVLVELEIVYACPATADERSQIDAWLSVNDFGLISKIWVSPFAVKMDGVEGPFRFRTGSAIRHGELIDEFTEAHFVLSRAVRWHVTPPSARWVPAGNRRHWPAGR